ncbi:MAG: aminotransferase class V-fold PLP-dependent enzyme [SAR202 cluster bacterium]|nr:aminotransferase class V-fold PLP-dependent enzyme [SAR202 cluster bacterium]
MAEIYLDYNATTPIDPQVAQAMLPYIHSYFGNPSSGHSFGAAAKQAVEQARGQVAALLGAVPQEVVFTSGGTEANNYAIKGVAGAYRSRGNHIITSAVEHPAVIEVCKHLETQGCAVTYLPVDQYGMVDPAAVERAITPRTILVTVMHANNEVGTIQPIRQIADIAHRHGVIVHSDCAQSIGKIPVNVDDLGVGLLSVAGHKLYAPKGVGALYVRSGIKLEKQMHGASHEMGWRAGTENVIEVVGLGQACELISRHLEEYQSGMGRMRDRLEQGLRRRFPDLRVNGHPTLRLPNTSSISLRGEKANEVLARLRGVAASAGAACHSDQVSISDVLKAMNVPLDYAMGTLRFSVGRYTTDAEIDLAVEEIARAAAAGAEHVKA